MLARPEVPSRQRYNLAGSLTMVFASGAGPGALWLGLCIVADPLIEQSGQRWASSGVTL
jgi:hypothetical protein